MVETLLKFYDRFRSYLIRIMPFGLPLKLLFGSLLTILGGAGFLGYISDYATYWYAMQAGFRTPLEGVPYLKAAVTFGSIFLLLTGGFLFALSIIMLSTLYSGVIYATKVMGFIITTPYSLLNKKGRRRIVLLVRLAKQSVKESTIGAQKKSLQYKITNVIFISIAIALISYNFLPYQGLTKTQMGLIGLAYGSVASIVVFFPMARWPLSFAFTISYFVACIIILFQPLYYSWFLKSIGYGGEIYIRLEVKDPILKQRIDNIETTLTLRTNDLYIVRDSKSNSFLEIPKDQAIFISYKVGTINNKKPEKLN